MGGVLGAEEQPTVQAAQQPAPKPRQQQQQQARPAQSDEARPEVKQRGEAADVSSGSAEPRSSSAASEAAAERRRLRQLEKKAESAERRKRRKEEQQAERDEEQRLFCETVFEALDSDGSGFVEIKELDNWLRNEPYFKNASVSTSAQSLLDLLDRDHDGKVCQEEFVRVFARLKDIENMTVNLLVHKLKWDQLPDGEKKKSEGSGSASSSAASSRTSSAARAAGGEAELAAAKPAAASKPA